MNSKPWQRKYSGDRFVAMAELTVRLGRSRVDIYKQARTDPNFLELVKFGNKTGALDSKVAAYLQALPKLGSVPPTQTTLRNLRKQPARDGGADAA